LDTTSDAARLIYKTHCDSKNTKPQKIHKKPQKILAKPAENPQKPAKKTFKKPFYSN
jgi:hypothetical protein